MVRPLLRRARRLRDADAVLALMGLVTLGTFVPFAALLRSGFVDPSERVLALSWWAGAAMLSGYGIVHLLAALADCSQFLDDHGTAHAGAGVVFCHALGQRLFVLVATGFALVVLAVLGAGVGAPAPLLVSLGLFAAVLLGPPTAVPVNRRVSERLASYRTG